MKVKSHSTKECYIAELSFLTLDNKEDWQHVDEICEQLWAEIKIMKTLNFEELYDA